MHKVIKDAQGKVIGVVHEDHSNGISRVEHIDCKQWDLVENQYPLGLRPANPPAPAHVGQMPQSPMPANPGRWLDPV